jgi:hypothetical protein
MDNDKAFGQRLAELEKEAHRQYEAKVAEEIAKDQDGYKDYSPILSWFSKKQNQAIRESISEEAIFDKLVSRDSIIARLNSDPDGKLPKSIETIIGHIIRSNEYLNSIGLHPFNADLRVYLMNEEVLGDKKREMMMTSAEELWGICFPKMRFFLSITPSILTPAKDPTKCFARWCTNSATSGKPVTTVSPRVAHPMKLLPSYWNGTPQNSGINRAFLRRETILS